METTNNILSSATSNANLVYEAGKRIAKMYLDKFPREYSYKITLTSSEDDSEGEFYFSLSDEEYAVLKAWKNLPEDDELYGCGLDEYLECNGYEKLRDRFLEHDSPYRLNFVYSCDLDDKLKFTKLGIHMFEKDSKTLKYERKLGFCFSDEEFCYLLLAIMMDQDFTMNKLVYKNTDLAKKLFKHLSYGSYENITDSPYPFIISFDVFADIADKILDPQKDLLGLFSSEDKEILSFANKYAHVPDSFVLYDEFAGGDNKFFIIQASFHGKNLFIYESGMDENGRWLDCDDLTVNADEICKKLNVDSYEALVEYLEDHYNTRTAICDLRECFHIQ